MQAITNFVENIFISTDNFVTSVLENRYFFITIVVLFLLYGSLNTSRLTANILACFDSPLNRLTMIGFIYYISTKNVPLAILMLAATVATMNSQNKQKLNFMMVSFFRGHVLPLRRLIKSKKQNKRLLNYIKYIKSSKKLSRKMSKKSSKRLSKKEKYRRLQILLKKISNYLDKKYSNENKNILHKNIIKTAKMAKDITKKLKIQTPKIVRRIISSLIPNEKINNLLKNKKISKEDADKLRKLNTKSLLKLLKSFKRKNSPKSNSSPKSDSSPKSNSSPKSDSSSVASTSELSSAKSINTPKVTSSTGKSEISTSSKPDIIFPKK